MATTTWVNSGSWGVYGYVSFGGVTEGGVVHGDLPIITPYATDMLVDGLLLRFLDAGGLGANAITVQLGVGPSLQSLCFVDDWLTTKSPETKQYALNGLPVTLCPRDGVRYLLRVSVTTALADKVYALMWGRFPVKELPGPATQPVSLEGYKWPLTRR